MFIFSLNESFMPLQNGVSNSLPIGALVALIQAAGATMSADGFTHIELGARLGGQCKRNPGWFVFSLNRQSMSGAFIMHNG